MDFTAWFDRCVGDWRSHRRYLTGTDRIIQNAETDFTIKNTAVNEYTYSLSWTGDGHEQIRMIIDDNILSLNRSYSDINTGLEYEMVRVDDDTVRFNSNVGGVAHYEEVRILGESDRFRIRTILEFSHNTNRVSVVGQYFESRL